MTTPLRAGLVGALLACALLARAQTPMYSFADPTGTTGGGNSSSLYFGAPSAKHNQTLYHAGDIAGVTSPIQYNRIYFRHGFNTATSGALDSLTIRIGQVTATAFSTNGFSYNAFFTGLPKAFYRASFTIPTGTQPNWWSIDLDTTLTYDPTLSLVVEILFKDNANYAYGLYGKYASTDRNRVYAGNFTDTTGSLSSSHTAHFGMDAVTALKPGAASVQLAVWPTPSSEVASMALPTPFTGVVDVYGADGKSAYHAECTATQRIDLPVSILRSGVYAVQLTPSTGATHYAARLLKR